MKIFNLYSMKIFATTILCYFIFMACKRNVSVETALNNAMLDHLYKATNYDSSHIKYRIQEVVYFEEPVNYTCEFKVRLIVGNELDTTGTMTADISKDYKTVKRKS